MNILGLNFFHANASAALMVDGKLVAAAEEERFNRVKFSAGVPLCAIGFCLKQAGLQFKDIDVITYPRATNTRIVNKDQIHFQDRIYKVTSLYDRYRINLKLINFKEMLAEHFGIPVETLVFKLREEDHHLSHMLSGFFYSPFDEALVLSCDAFGDFVSVKAGVGRGNKIEIVRQVEFPHSIGLFYTMVTQFLGFSGYGDESKVMGLSTYGYPEYTDKLRTIISADHGTLRLNLKFFNQESGVGTTWADQTPDITRIYNENLTRLMGDQRRPEDEITSRHQNIAASVQHLTEEIMFGLIEDLHAAHPITNLVLTGGLAYNSLLNARIIDETPIQNIYVPPSPGNSGLAVGSALAFLGDQAATRPHGSRLLGPGILLEGHRGGGHERRGRMRRSSPTRSTRQSSCSSREVLSAGSRDAWNSGRAVSGVVAFSSIRSPRILGASSAVTISSRSASRFSKSMLPLTSTPPSIRPSCPSWPGCAASTAANSRMSY